MKRECAVPGCTKEILSLRMLSERPVRSSPEKHGRKSTDLASRQAVLVYLQQVSKVNSGSLPNPDAEAIRVHLQLQARLRRGPT